MRILLICHDIAHVRDYYQNVLTTLSEQHQVIIAAPQTDEALSALKHVSLVMWDWPAGFWQIKSRYQARRRMARIIQLHHPEVVWSVGQSVSSGLRRLLGKKRHWRWVTSLASAITVCQWQRLARRADEVVVHHAEVAPPQASAQLIPAPTVMCPAKPKALP